MAGEKILIVEDSHTQAVEIAEILSANQYDVTIKNDGLSAFQYLKELQEEDLPSVIITDVHMPRMDGFAFSEKVKKHIAPDIYILFLTVEKTEDALEKAFRAGATDYIKKPASPIELLLRTENLIRLKRANQACNLSTDKLKISKEKLKELADKDKLTKAYNRMYFINDLIQKTYNYSRYNTCFSLCMFGIDGLKKINRDHGQEIGDIVLQKVVDIILARIRLTDVLARYDGDIFVATFPNIDLNHALSAVKKIHNVINEISIDNYNIKPTICSSVLQYDGKKYKDYNDFLNQAKRLMDLAKSKGRNVIEHD